MSVFKRVFISTPIVSHVTDTAPKCFLVSSCQGASVVAVRPTERSTAAFPTVPPLTVSTPPMSPTTAAPSVGAVSLTSDGNQMFQVQISRFSTSGVSIHSISLGLNSFLCLKSLQGTLQDVRLCSEICVNLFKLKERKNPDESLVCKHSKPLLNILFL